MSSGRDDCVADIVLLDVEMKTVEQHPAMRAADPPDVGNAFRRSVHDELLEAIHNLDVEKHIAVLHHLDHLRAACQAMNCK